MGEAAPLWWQEELDAWRLPEELRVSEWCDKYRQLSPRTTASPGRWSTDRVPYSREILDVFGEPTVEEITFVASTQVSKTETALNCLAYAIDNDPKTALFVLPTDTDCRKMAADRLQPLILDNPHLAQHTTGDPDDIKLTALQLKECTVYLSSSNSPSQLASMPVKYLFLDETDKYKAFSGGEASPIKLARERTRTFWDRKIFKSCTPTTEDGYILQEYQKSDRGRYYVPCPHCSHWQLLSWKNIQYPDGADAEAILADDLADYFCPGCGEAVPDKAKPAMLRAGQWVPTRYQEVDPRTGQVHGELPRKRPHRGFHINCLYSPWLTWSEIAAEFVRSKDNPQDLMNFVNSWLGEAWKDRSTMPAEEQLLALRNTLPAALCPADTLGVTMGIDMQARGFYWAAYAHRREHHSHLLGYGYADSWEELAELVLESRYPIQGDADRRLAVARALLDTGGGRSAEDFSRTEEAYLWLRQHGAGVVHGCKGLSNVTTGSSRNRASQVDQMPGKKRGSFKGLLTLRLLDTNAYKDELFRKLSGSGQQHISFHSATGSDYTRQLLAEQRRRNPRTGRYEWVEVRRDNHYLDATIYAHAAADPAWNGGFLARRRKAAAGPTVVIRGERRPVM